MVYLISVGVERKHSVVFGCIVWRSLVSRFELLKRPKPR